MAVSGTKNYFSLKTFKRLGKKVINSHLFSFVKQAKGYFDLGNVLKIFLRHSRTFQSNRLIYIKAVSSYFLICFHSFHLTEL